MIRKDAKKSSNFMKKEIEKYKGKSKRFKKWNYQSKKDHKFYKAIHSSIQTAIVVDKAIFSLNHK